MAHKSVMAKPMKALKFHYPMIQVLIMCTIYSLQSEKCLIQAKTTWLKLAFWQCFWLWNPNNTRKWCTWKYKGYEIWSESFKRIEKSCQRLTFEQFKDIFLAITDFINHQVTFHPAIGRNDYRRVHRQNYQLLFKKALARRCEGKH